MNGTEVLGDAVGWARNALGEAMQVHKWQRSRQQRAGFTKNHNRGQSKVRRKMAAESRRRNRK